MWSDRLLNAEICVFQSGGQTVASPVQIGFTHKTVIGYQAVEFCRCLPGWPRGRRFGKYNKMELHVCIILLYMHLYKLRVLSSLLAGSSPLQPLLVANQGALSWILAGSGPPSPPNRKQEVYAAEHATIELTLRRLQIDQDILWQNLTIWGVGSAVTAQASTH